jgi:preprotein translocase subunit SecE
LFGVKAIENIKTFLNEVRTEMKKVSWSSKAELVSSAWIVIISVFVFTVILWIFDSSFSAAIHVVLKQGS